jgi:hypothetical protein
MSQRRALGALFLFLAALFAGIAFTAFGARVWIIGIAGAVLAVWLLTMAARALRSP